ncbi:hypothetical protein LCGC14_3150430, partial [marine sediment metagenome]
MTVIKKAIVKSYDAATHKADVQIAGSLTVWLDAVRVATNIPSADVVAGRQCTVLFLDPSNQDDALILTIQGATPSGGGGGATTFGPIVRDHAHGLQKKVRKLALKTALSSKQADGKLMVVETASLDAPKTKTLAAVLGKLGLSRALFIDGPQIDANFHRAAANLIGVDVLPQQGAN